MLKRPIAPLAALVLALLAAPSADAALTVAADGAARTVTVTGDAAADTLTIAHNVSDQLTHNLPIAGNLASERDWDPVAAGDQVVPAAENDLAYTIVLDTGGGGDAVTITTAKVKAVVADLGDGDDLYQGATANAGRADAVDGGPGDDRIAAGRGDDDMRGGDGNDTLVWNNGDGSDAIDGEGGTDTVEANGSPSLSDAFIIRPGEAGRLRFERTNLNPFLLTIATTTERLQVNGLGGDDDIETVGSAGVLLSLDGGTGDDSLIGGEAADVLTGGDDTDALIGGGGDDVLAGDRGDDTMGGGEGSDRLVWRNGDGSDTAAGDAGFDVLAVEGAGAGDAFAVRPDAGGARVERTNLAPFSIAVSTAEALDLRLLGGDDVLAVAAATPLLVNADGGTGDDALTGGDGADILGGGSGADKLTGGAGLDLLSGDDGDDTVAARDDRGDVVRCGAGTDSATLDAATLDDASDCETADRPAGAGGGGGGGGTPVQPGAAAIRILTGKVRTSRGRTAISLQCPAGGRACAGEIALATARAVRVGRARVVVALGSARFDVAPGKTATVTVRLTKSLAAIAGRAKSLKARAVAATQAGGGATLPSSKALTLTRGPKRW